MGSSDTDRQRSGYRARLLSKKRKTTGEHADAAVVSDALESSSSNAKKPKIDDAGKSTDDRSCLPAEIWHHIFTFCPPRTLGNLLCVNKLFNAYLDPASSVVVEKSPPVLDKSSVKALEPNAIWRGSRRSFWPNMPGPLKEKTELDMWRLACSSTCQFCGKPDTRRPLSPPNVTHTTGPGPNGVACIWEFRVRCCRSCLLSKTLKEMDLVLSAASTFLLPALQFVFVDSDTCVIPLSVIERGLLPPASTPTKLFWTSDVEALREEFSSVRELGAPAAEEWQKGLSTRGANQRTDIAKWEKYAENGGVANMRSLLYPGYKAKLAIPAGLAMPVRDQLASQTGDATKKPPKDHSSDGVVSRMSTNKHVVGTAPAASPASSGKEKTREEIDAEWDEIQGPVRFKILKYADEAINGDWDEGDKVTKNNAPAFAADVLLHVRKRFYMEVEKDAKDARAAGREPIVDPVGGPFTQKLSLENMKYVFDVKVKPITSKFRNDLFLCPCCDANMKFFGFEGVIQHYAAKHTTALSVGNIVVYWRAEWPEDPPFRPNPRVSKSTGQPLPLQQPLPPRPPNHHSFPPPPTYHGKTAFQKYSSHSWEPPVQPPLPPPPPPPMLMPSAPEYYSPHQQAQTHQFPEAIDIVRNGTQYSSVVHFDAEPPRLLPDDVDAYAAEPMPTAFHHPHSTHQSYVESIHVRKTIPPTAPSHSPIDAPSTAQVLHHPHNTLPPDGYASSVGGDAPLPTPTPGVFYATKYNETVREIQHIWSCIGQLRSVPGVVRLLTLLYHANKFFQAQFGEQLPLTLFTEGLSDRKALGPVRSVSELPCKACHQDLGCIPGTKEDRSLFTLPQLLHHFARAHIGSRGARLEPATPPLDWLQDMLILPQPTALSDIVKKTRVFGKASHLLSEAVEDLQRREDGRQQPLFDVAAARRKTLSDRNGTISPIDIAHRPAQHGLGLRNMLGGEKNLGGESGKYQRASGPAHVNEAREHKHKAAKPPASRPAVAIKHESMEHAQVQSLHDVPMHDAPMHDARVPAEENQPDLLGALEMHLKGAPAPSEVQPQAPRAEMMRAQGQARVIYVDEKGRELIPRRDIRGGPVYDDDGYARYATDERERPPYQYQQSSMDASQRRGTYRMRSPLPARRYADESGYRVRQRDYHDMYDLEPTQSQPPLAYEYQRVGPHPPRQGYYEDYADESGRRISLSRPHPAEHDRYEAYEVVRVVDPDGDYYARRPVRREYPPPAGHRDFERYFEPALDTGGLAVPPGRAHGGVPHDDSAYGAPYDTYAYKRGPERTWTGDTRMGATAPHYEEYDPRHPAEGARKADEPGTAASHRGLQHTRYQ